MIRLLLAGASLLGGAAHANCLVVGIADGDTLTARCGETGSYQQVKVRIAEIDAPEKRQPFGEQSRQSLANLCFQKIAVLHVQTTDRYKRTVARVECAGVDASAHQLNAGMAWFYVKYGKDRNLQEAEEGARAARTGLWVEAEPVAPWEWRMIKRARS